MKNIPTDKIPDLVQVAADSVGISAADCLKLIDRIKDMLPSDDVDEEKAPRQKTQFGILTNADRSAGWVFTLPEEGSVHTIEGSVRQAGHAWNATKKGRMLPVKTIGEACESVPARFFKDAGLTCKTKMPVIVMATNNELGEAPSC
jgi:hypothetical protein